MTAIYHITHIRNLPSIIGADGLHCDQTRMDNSLASVSIAHQHIKDRRANRKVPISPGGTLANYVPFYFAPRSPMLFAISKNQVDGYTSGQAPILHLESDAESVARAGVPFTFTDGHAEMAVSEFSSDISALRSKIDWSLMNSRYWNDTVEYPDRKRKRQAEFLLHAFAPWTLIMSIGVINQQLKEEVEAILSPSQHRPPVKITPNWYY